jgi:hypothetical protein
MSHLDRYGYNGIVSLRREVVMKVYISPIVSFLENQHGKNLEHAFSLLLFRPGLKNINVKNLVIGSDHRFMVNASSLNLSYVDKSLKDCHLAAKCLDGVSRLNRIPGFESAKSLVDKLLKITRPSEDILLGVKSVRSLLNGQKPDDSLFLREQGTSLHSFSHLRLQEHGKLDLKKFNFALDLIGNAYEKGAQALKTRVEGGSQTGIKLADDGLRSLKTHLLAYLSSAKEILEKNLIVPI